jgi:hypothetical protein
MLAKLSGHYAHFLGDKKCLQGTAPTRLYRSQVNDQEPAIIILIRCGPAWDEIVDRCRRNAQALTGSKQAVLLKVVP